MNSLWFVVVFLVGSWNESLPEAGAKKDLSHHKVGILYVADEWRAKDPHALLPDLKSSSFDVVYTGKGSFASEKQKYEMPLFRFVGSNEQVIYQDNRLPEDEILLSWVLAQATQKEPGSYFLGKERTFLQKNRTDCAAACTMIMLERLGGVPSQEKIYNNLDFGEFASLLDIKKFLEGEGYSVSGLRGSFANLRKEKGPVILQVDGQHFVVLSGFIGSGAVIVDPALGRFFLTDSALSKRWNGFWLRVDGSG